MVDRKIVYVVWDTPCSSGCASISTILTYWYGCLSPNHSLHEHKSLLSRLFELVVQEWTAAVKAGRKNQAEVLYTIPGFPFDCQVDNGIQELMDHGAGLEKNV